MMPAMAFCKSEEFTIAKVGNSFCNFVLFHYAINKNPITPKNNCSIDDPKTLVNLMTNPNDGSYFCFFMEITVSHVTSTNSANCSCFKLFLLRKSFTVLYIRYLFPIRLPLITSNNVYSLPYIVYGIFVK